MKFNIISYAFLGGIKNFKISSGMIGGQEIYLYDLAKLLIKNSCDVTIIQAGEKNEIFFFEDIKIKKIKTINRYLFNLSWKKHIDKNADKIHLHDFEDSFPFGNSQLTGTCHGVTWDCPETSFYWKFHNFYHKFLAKHAVKKLGKIASVDSFLLRFLQSEMPNYRDKTNVIHSYVKTNIFNPKVNGKNIKKKYNNKPIILFPRNLSYIRGPFLILEAMKEIRKKIPDVVLIMTGEGPAKHKVIKIIKKNKLQKNVILEGHKNHLKEMPQLYAAADVVVIPSLGREGCSLSCLEAMATKKPVVVTNIGGLIDIIIDNFNGLISKTNPKELGEKIVSLLENKKMSKKISMNGYKWVKKYFNYKIWCEKYSSFFGVD